jgi:hypothetical protein
MPSTLRFSGLAKGFSQFRPSFRENKGENAAWGFPLSVVPTGTPESEATDEIWREGLAARLGNAFTQPMASK